MYCTTMGCLLLFLTILLHPVCAREYFVSVSDGSDSNPGTQDKPWKHVQKAVSALQPGDICTIRGGRYYEEVSISGLKGTQDKPITFRSYPGESVVFDGTKGPIKAEWKKYKGDIYETTLEYDIWQLFVDGQSQVNARWPNAFWYDYSVFDYTRWAFSAHNSTYDKTTGRGVMCDNGTQGLAESGINATGSIAILNIGSWLTWAGVVDKHSPGDPNLSFHLESAKKIIKFQPRNSRFYLEDKLEFLDAPTEWYYDKESRKLFLWTQSSDSPENYEITGKVSTYAFTVTNGSSWIDLIGLNFFATTVFINGETPDRDVEGITLDSCHFTYPSYSKRMLKSLLVPNTTTIYYNGDLRGNAGNFIIFNCTWEFADGQTMKYRAGNGIIRNNLWHHNDFSCVGDGMLFKSEGAHDHFLRNTIHSNGPSEGFLPGPGTKQDQELGLNAADTVQLSLFYDLKYLQDDGAQVQTTPLAQNGTVLEYNWSFNTRKNGLRFDGGGNITGGGYNGTMSHNVVWNTREVNVKGFNHYIKNNLIFNSSNEYDMVTDNTPIVFNNIIQNGVCNSTNVVPCPNKTSPGNFSNNAYDNVYDHLRDPDNFDFRPKPMSNYISRGIGPYGEESMKHGGVYWIPGRQLFTASMPIPLNGTKTARCDADLMWLGGFAADSHDVYFGTDKVAVTSATPSSPEFQGNFKLPSNIVNPGPMKQRTKYYWRVDAKLEDTLWGTEVWEFECQRSTKYYPHAILYNT